MGAKYDASYDSQIQLLQGNLILAVGATGVIDVAAGGMFTYNGVQQGPTAPITDDTGGTPSTTFAAITAGAGYAQADMVAVKNALSSIAAQFNALLLVIQNLGMST